MNETREEGTMNAKRIEKEQAERRMPARGASMPMTAMPIAAAAAENRPGPERRTG